MGIASATGCLLRLVDSSTYEEADIDEVHINSPVYVYNADSSHIMPAPSYPVFAPADHANKRW